MFTSFSYKLWIYKYKYRIINHYVMMKWKLLEVALTYSQHFIFALVNKFSAYSSANFKNNRNRDNKGRYWMKLLDVILLFIINEEITRMGWKAFVAIFTLFLAKILPSIIIFFLYFLLIIVLFWLRFFDMQCGMEFLLLRAFIILDVDRGLM